MKSKATLILIELSVMLLVFVVAAALCMQAFAWAEETSVNSDDRSRAIAAAQSAAERIKYCRGDFETVAQAGGGEWNGSLWQLNLDENWQETDQSPAFVLQAQPMDTTEQYLGGAEITVLRNGQSIASLSVYWQEVAP